MEKDAPQQVLSLDVPVGSELPLVIDGVEARYRVTRVEEVPGYPRGSGPIHLERADGRGTNALAIAEAVVQLIGGRTYATEAEAHEFATKVTAQAVREAYDRGWSKATRRVAEVCAEFGGDPKACLSILGEWLR